MLNNYVTVAGVADPLNVTKTTSIPAIRSRLWRKTRSCHEIKMFKPSPDFEDAMGQLSWADPLFRLDAHKTSKRIYVYMKSTHCNNSRGI